MNSFEKLYIERLPITQNLLRTVRLLGEFKGKQELFTRQTPQVLETLRQAAIIQSTESSNRIEGVTAPIERIKALVAQKTKPRDRSEQEILGYRDVLNAIHTSYPDVPFTTNVALQFHGNLYRYTESQGGKWKLVDNEIREELPDGTRLIRFKPISAFATADAMERLHREFNDSRDSGQFEQLLLIPAYALDFLCIHPFLDGNGRMSRLLTLLLLYQAGCEVGRYISLEKLVEQTKESYHEALNKSSQGWHKGQHDLMPWVEYLLGLLVAAYREFEERVGTLTTARGAKTQMVLDAVRHLPEEFRLTEVERICPQVTRDMIRTFPLSELVKFASGGTPNREAAHFWNGDIPWLSAKDLKKFRLNDSIEKITREGANNGTRLVEAGNVLILVRGMTLLKDVRVGVTERAVAFNQDLKALIPKGEVDGHYLGFYLVANKSRLLALVDQAGHGAGRLPSDLLQSFEIELPGLQEQRKIADILLTWERAIEGAEKLIAAKSRLKRGLMRQLLTGRKRFSQFDGQKWKRVRLDEICEINRGTLSERTDPAYEFFYLDISSVGKGSVSSPASKIRFKDAPSRARRIVRKNDILMSTVRPNLQAFAWFTDEDDDVIASTGFAVITAKREVDIAFVYHSLFSDDTAQQINALIAGSNYPTVTPSQAGSLKLPLPRIDEQRRIAAALNTCDRELDLLRRQLAALKRQKQGLMQKLLTGQTLLDRLPAIKTILSRQEGV